MNDVISKAKIKMNSSILAIHSAIPLLFLIIWCLPVRSFYDIHYGTGEKYKRIFNLFDIEIQPYDEWIVGTVIALIILVICFVVSFLLLNSSKKCALYLYSNRVEGTLKVLFTSRSLNLPIDKIDSIMSSSGFTDKLYGGKSVLINTASGRMRFRAVHNADEFVAETLKAIESNKSTKQTAKETPQTSSSMDDLKKLKDLLDSGVISEEEFNAKKKQILGL